MGRYTTRIFICIAAIMSAACAGHEAAAQTPPADTGTPPVEIPLGGNSYVTTSGGPGGGRVTDKGFESWRSHETVFATFFRVNRSGDLRLALRYGTAADGNTIEIKCLGNVFEVELPKPVTQRDTVVLLGALENVAPGYVKVEMRGKTLGGETFAEPRSILVSGTSTADMNFVGDFSFYWGRRGPSVHMNYSIPDRTEAEWFYNEVTVPVGYDSVGSYFMANGFGEGYFGMQVNSPTERRVLFSVWSPFETDDPKNIPEEDRVKLIRAGEGVTVNDFGNEGSGGQSYMKYDWQAGKTYRFLNRVRPVEGGYSEYTAWFCPSDTDRWILVASWKRPKTQTYYTRPHSFLENFSTSTGHITRKGLYANQWIRTPAGEWLELTRGRFTVDATGRPGWRMDYKGGLEDGGEQGFFLQNCGFFDDRVEPDTVFERPAGGKQPVINLDDLEGKTN